MMTAMSLFILTSLFDHLLKIVVVLGVLSVLCFLCVWTISFLIFAVIYLLRVLEQRSLRVDPFQNQPPWAEYLDFREPDPSGLQTAPKMTIVESAELNLLEKEDLEAQQRQNDAEAADIKE